MSVQATAQSVKHEALKVKHQLEDAQERLGEIDARVRGAVQARPLIMLASALFGGYLVGRIVARR